MKENIIQKKSYSFALKIIGLYQSLISDKREFVLAKQLLRSGTSVGANVEEASGGQSRNDFIFKLTIAYKEARETSYWMRLLRDSGIVSENEISPLMSDCDEILRILGSIQKTIKEGSTIETRNNS